MKRTYFALAAALTALLLLVPTAAQANTYDVYSCWAGYGTFHNPNASSAAWTRDQTSSGGHFAIGDLCGVDRGSGALSIVSLSGPSASQGQNAEVAVTAPMGNTIAGASLWRRAWTYGTGSGSSSQRNSLTAMTSGTLYRAEADGTVDVPLGSRGTGDTTDHGVNAGNLLTLNLGSRMPSKFSYRVGCGFAAGCLTTSSSSPYANNYASGVEIFGSVLTIDDSSDPALMVGNTGLFDGQNATGVELVEVQSASDPAGIKRLAVFADGAVLPIGVVDYEQDVNHCDWSRVAPCLNGADVAIPVDTSGLADGLHSFVVKAFDAAENERTSTTHYVTVDNQPDPIADPPTDPTPDPTPSDPGSDPGAGGTGTSSDVGLPNGSVDGGSGGSVAVTGQPKLNVLFDGNGKARYAARYNRMVVVRGVLVDGTGARIANAQVDYTAQSTTPRARVQNLGSVRTDSSGTFNLTVATKLGSRKLRFSYSPQIGGTPTASAEAQLDVIAPVSLKIAPKHVRNGKSVTFRGRLSAGPIPHRGKLVNLQVRLYGHWHTFATVRTSQSGRFKYRYRFRRTYGYVVYRFRARSRYEAAYPFVAGSSHTVRVAVTSCPVGCD